MVSVVLVGIFGHERLRRPLDTRNQMNHIARAMPARRLPYDELIAACVLSQVSCSLLGGFGLSVRSCR